MRHVSTRSGVYRRRMPQKMHGGGSSSRTPRSTTRSRASRRSAPASVHARLSALLCAVHSHPLTARARPCAHNRQEPGRRALASPLEAADQEQGRQTRSGAAVGGVRRLGGSCGRGVECGAGLVVRVRGGRSRRPDAQYLRVRERKLCDSASVLCRHAPINGPSARKIFGGSTFCIAPVRLRTRRS